LTGLDAVLRVVAASLGLLLALSPAVADERSAPCFRRGVAIHNMMNWAAVEQSDATHYAAPAFAGPTYEVSDQLLRNVAQAGFDFVRLTVDPGPFIQFTGNARDALDERLKAVVERLLSNGFCVIVDFHPNEQVPAYAPDKLVQASDDPLFRAFARTIGRTGGLLASLNTDRVALELLNEPQYGWDAATTSRWQGLLQELHRVARAQAPNLLFVLSGARGGDIKGLAALDPRPFAESNVIYSFHYYEPHDFTHQGVKSATPYGWPWRYLSHLPYPAHSDDPNKVWYTIRQNVLGDPTITTGNERWVALQRVRDRVSSYLSSGFDRSQIVRDFDEVVKWTSRYKIDPRSILLGEFNVTRTYGQYRAADPDSREAWLRDVRSEAEHRGFGWALWALSGYGGMALVESDGENALDPVTLRALGLYSAR
jgi:endoglucanase